MKILNRKYLRPSRLVLIGDQFLILFGFLSALFVNYRLTSNTPFPIHADQKEDATIDIHTQHVVYSYEPAKDYVDNYKEIFGSKLVLPNKTLITG